MSREPGRLYGSTYLETTQLQILIHLHLKPLRRLRANQSTNHCPGSFSLHLWRRTRSQVGSQLLSQVRACCSHLHIPVPFCGHSSIQIKNLQQGQGQNQNPF